MSSTSVRVNMVMEIMRGIIRMSFLDEIKHTQCSARVGLVVYEKISQHFSRPTTSHQPSYQKVIAAMPFIGFLILFIFCHINSACPFPRQNIRNSSRFFL